MKNATTGRDGQKTMRAEIHELKLAIRAAVRLGHAETETALRAVLFNKYGIKVG